MVVVCLFIVVVVATLAAAAVVIALYGVCCVCVGEGGGVRVLLPLEKI